jgi:chaperonin GroEL
LNGDNISNVKLSDFGSAASIRSSNTDTVITGVDGDHELVQQRIQDLTDQIQTLDQASAEMVVERLNRLQSGVGVIKVGGNSQVEVVEKRHRIEDALEAVKSAQEEGVVPGGSWMLMYARNLLHLEKDNTMSDNDRLASKILEEAFSIPLKTMISNSGLSIDIDQVYTFENLTQQSGINLLTGEVTDLYESGIIDPFKVVRCCIKNAISTAGNLLTTNYAILNQET